MDDDFYRNRFFTMREGLCLARRGIEIGPLDRPIVKRSDGDITYVDFTDTESLRREYAANPRRDVSKFVDIDAVWGAQTLAECLNGGRFDYLIACHVVEHVPDIVTWLEEVREVLEPGGELRMAWPDCRFSFDVLRRETDCADVLTNYLLRARRPTLRNVLEFLLYYARDMDGWGRYEGRFDVSRLAPTHAFGGALAAAAWSRDAPDTYFDVHCWVFQPRSFALVMAKLAEEGLVRFACDRLIDPSMPLLEFYAFLKPCDDRDEAVVSWRKAAAAARDPLPGSAEARLVDRAAELEAELAEARRALSAVHASTSWRLAAPLRRIMSLVK